LIQFTCRYCDPQSLSGSLEFPDPPPGIPIPCCSVLGTAGELGLQESEEGVLGFPEVGGEGKGSDEFDDVACHSSPVQVLRGFFHLFQEPFQGGAGGMA